MRATGSTSALVARDIPRAAMVMAFWGSFTFWLERWPVESDMEPELAIRPSVPVFMPVFRL